MVSNSDYCSISIDKLMQWRANNWINYFNTPTNLVFTVHYDQAIIYSDQKVVETLSLTGKIKGFFKNNVLIIITKDNIGGLHKIKFLLKFNVSQCIEILRKYFPVLSHDSRSTKNISRYQGIDEIFKKVVNTDESTSYLADLPPDYGKLVKLCLMDPSFPRFVKETQKIIETLLNDAE